MKISATISPHQVKAVILHYTPYGKVVARLTFLRGRSRWPAFWPDEDWDTWCLLAYDPVGSSPCLCGPVLLVATLVVLGEIFNATLGYVCAPLPTLRFLILRPVVPCSDSLFLFFILRCPGEGPPSSPLCPPRCDKCGQVVEVASPPLRRTEWKVGAGVYVIPGTGKDTLPKNMEPFPGRIVRRCDDDEDYYMVYNTIREGAKKKGSRIHVNKITRLEQDGVSPAVMSRVRYRDL